MIKGHKYQHDDDYDTGLDGRYKFLGPCKKCGRINADLIHNLPFTNSNNARIGEKR